ncbi:putative alpha-galactosidase [Nocardia nova SH22a]|uniref:Alpha-galactosidase n=2 Tax=Nocardia nova TaxID=37330 RepID=W5TJV3_9NOCA|nr:putative alpha-galactosidase [Nocardia nova SH22a]
MCNGKAMRSGKRFAALAAALLAGVTVAAGDPARADAPAVLPPMGWNSWNSGIPMNEAAIHQTIDAMVSSGMRDAGYRYVNLDAGWAAPQRTPDGDLQADPQRFPHGIAAVAAYAHDRGMLLGVYSSPYNQICGQTPGNASLGHETQDARKFAEWGVDYLKYDWCRTEADHDDQVRDFVAMRDALHSTGRRIVYSINPNSSDDAEAGIAYDWSGIADVVRDSGDLIPVWDNTLPPMTFGEFDSRGFLGISDQFAAARRAPAARDYLGDPDMLVVGLSMAEFVAAHLTGMPQLAAEQGVLSAQEADFLGRSLQLPSSELTALRVQNSLTPVEEQTHFSLWAMLSAPLLAGNDVRTMNERTRALLTNRAVIAIDQDPLRATPAPVGGDDRILTKRLANGSVALALFNPSDQPSTIETSTAALSLTNGSPYRLSDVWSGEARTTTGPIAAADIPAHGVRLLHITPAG